MRVWEVPNARFSANYFPVLPSWNTDRNLRDSFLDFILVSLLKTAAVLRFIPEVKIRQQSDTEEPNLNLLDIRKHVMDCISTAILHPVSTFIILSKRGN